MLYSMSPSDALVLDVRPLLREGVEPLPAIIEAKSRLAPGQSLRLLAPFDPKPLYGIFEADDFSTQTRKIDESLWEICFSPGEADTSATLHQIDLRGKHANERLRQSLDAVSCLERGQSLELHTSDRPEDLLKTLSRETTDYDCEPAGTGHWVTTIWRLSI